MDQNRECDGRRTSLQPRWNGGWAEHRARMLTGRRCRLAAPQAPADFMYIPRTDFFTLSGQLAQLLQASGQELSLANRVKTPAG